MDRDAMNGADTDCASNAQSTDKNESFIEMILRKYLMGKQTDIFLAGCECKCAESDDEQNVLKKIDTYKLIYNMHGMLSDTIKRMGKIEPTDLIGKIIYIEIWLEYRGVDLWQVVRLKLDYNKNRPALHGRKY